MSMYEPWLDEVVPEVRRIPTVPVEVVETKSQEFNDQVNAAYGTQTTDMVVMKPVELALPPVRPPENLYPDTLIPLGVRAPTAWLVSEEYGFGAGMPWTVSPASVVAFPIAIGALLVYLGKEVIAQLAISALGDLVTRVKKKFNVRGIRFRYLTGYPIVNQPGPRVRVRLAGGGVPEEREQGENPDSYTEFRAWTWF